jgi:MmyB-like transcription regulator ligand binding domain
VPAARTDRPRPGDPGRAAQAGRAGPGGPGRACRAGRAEPAAPRGRATPLRLASDAGELSLLYTTTVFGSPRDVTLDEIAIETFFPADDTTAETPRALAGPPAR